ncbi:MAG: DUF1818 family protein [Phormidesmis sp.]
MIRHLEEGDGWRVGWNPAAEKFCGLVAGDRWSIELTADEFSDFCRVARQLNKTMRDMSQHLMDEERLTCEQETEQIWMEAEGFPQSHSLRFILRTGRRGEGGWPPPQVTALMTVLMRSPFAALTEGTHPDIS